ncbi:hypothetical protein BO70DRAFT_428830 [Aspergillus heteromorphus CBS 117.55]|uniref:Uncharacterized protein n=1 Tax=Aspergillus heteromorphus CBS 117.55 TaxID=1448321 RepID=A0A317WE93_9EURO|nr:uncharacterized protein BO70DRAFT_428830 [Aspergillus heteromorphus CBS 117.55]PWY83552.1 hypothetical protein BO70DRAFT_428830 [Aspergillus heteromorphus CBS 117.55]
MGDTPQDQPIRKQILLNAFDMCTMGHLSPGQWKASTPPTSPGCGCLRLMQKCKPRAERRRQIRHEVQTLLLDRTRQTARARGKDCGNSPGPPTPETDSYIDPTQVRLINHVGKYFTLHMRHIVDPSPQRTPFLFQAGTSAAGSAFAATHDDVIFFFATFTSVVGRADAEAQAKLAEARRHASVVGGLVLFSGWTGIDILGISLDRELGEESVGWVDDDDDDE